MPQFTSITKSICSIDDAAISRHEIIHLSYVYPSSLCVIITLYSRMESSLEIRYTKEKLITASH